MRRAGRKALVLAATVFVIIALAGMVSPEAGVICPGRQVCVMVNDSGGHLGGQATGIVFYTEPTLEGHVLLECSSAHNDALHANLYVGERWYSYNPTIDRQIC